MSRGNGGSITVINTVGSAMVVDISTEGGSRATAYTDDTLTTTVALPATITSTTTFWVSEGGYTISVKVNGVEVAGTPDGTRTVRLANWQSIAFAPSLDEARVPDQSGTYAPLSDHRRLAPPQASLIAATHTDAGQYRPIGIDPTDGGLLGWYFAGGRFVKSTDDGATWATWNVPTAATDLIARGVREVQFTASGEALAVVQSASGVGESVWKSSGIATPATATWTVKQTLADGLSYFYGGFHVYRDIVLTSEYGPQTDQSAPANARRAYLSTDAGSTFTQIFDLNTTVVSGEGAAYGSGSTRQHLHGLAYDPWWSRIWLNIGDASTSPTGYAVVVYSDDSGTTWTAYPGTKSNLPGKLSLVPTPLADAIVFASDSEPTGTYTIPRLGFRVGGTYALAHAADLGSGIRFVGRHRWRNSAVGSPLLLSYTGVLSDSPGTLVATWDGVTFHTVYRDDEQIPGGANYRGLERAYGPTNTGKVVAYFNDQSRYTAGSIMVARTPTRPSKAMDRSELRAKFLSPDNIVGAESIPRASTIATTTAVTSGTLYLTAVALPRDEAVKKLSFFAAASVPSPTGWWLGLFDRNRNLLAVSANQGATAISGGAINTVSIATTADGAATSYTPLADDLYYIGLLLVGTGLTLQSANNNTALTGKSPIIIGSANTGLSAPPPAFPFQASALTALATVPYVYAASA